MVIEVEVVESEELFAVLEEGDGWVREVLEEVLAPMEEEREHNFKAEEVIRSEELHEREDELWEMLDLSKERAIEREGRADRLEFRK